MLTQQDYRTWFSGHATCSPQKDHHRFKGLTMRDYDHSTFTMLVSYEGWVHAMAGKKSTKASSWGNIEFINLTLDEGQRKDFKSWLSTKGETIVDELGQIMVDDYRLSCNWDDNNQCFIATLTGKQDQRHNTDKALSARSDDWWEAIALVVYKHQVIFSGGLWTGEGVKNNWG